MDGAVSDSPRQNVRLARIARLMTAALLVPVLSFAICAQLQVFDASALSELVCGFADLLHTKSAAAATAPSLAIWASVVYCLGLLVFSFAAVWSGYYLQMPARFICSVQLSIISAFYTWLCWLVLAVQGRPVSACISIVSGCIAGWLLKMRDDERRNYESKHFELKLRNRELQESRLALIRQDEAERRLLAADLHDQVLNDLRTVQKNFDQYKHGHDEGCAQEIAAQLKRSMNDIREIMDDLCPVVLEESGLGAAIEDRLDTAAKNHKLKVRFLNEVPDSQLDSLTPVEQQLVYRLIQESVTNVCKHAEASHVRIHETAAMEVFNTRARIILEAFRQGFVEREDIAALESELAEWLERRFNFELSR